MDKIYELLLAIHNEENITQRKLAQEVGLSLGTTNTLLNFLEEKNWIAITQVKRKYHYQLTKAGREKLTQLLDQMKKTRLSIPQKDRKIKKAVILAAGKPVDFDFPSCLVPLDEKGTTPLERTLQLLNERGMEDIYVVVGYEKDKITANPLFNHLHFIETKDYSYSGTMASLSKVFPVFHDDFLLIEGDLVFEGYVLDKLLSDEEANGMTCVNVSGSRDEAFVDFNEDGYLVRISKDIRQMNRISSEMMGITKVSQEMWEELQKLYQFNNNQWLNYEYLILQASETYDVKCVFTDNTIWGDIDDEKSLQQVQKDIFPNILRKEGLRQIEDAKKRLAEIMDVSEEKITDIHFAGGMTNNNYAATVEGENYFIRIPGKATEIMINRENEALNAQLGSAIGLNVETYYINAQTGIKITKAIEKAETLSKRSAKVASTMEEVANILKTLHTSDITFPNEFSFMKEWEKYEKTVERTGASYYPHYEDVKKQVLQMAEILRNKYGILSLPCHNDLVPENFVRNGRTQKLYLIDWEYSGTNDPSWDLAAFSIENELSKEEKEFFLKAYYGREATKEELTKVKMYEVFQDMLWAVWTIMKEAAGSDFGSYGQERFDRCQKQVKEILDEESH